MTNVVLYGISYITNLYCSIAIHMRGRPISLCQLHTSREKLYVLSRQQIKDMITAGNYIVIVEQNVLKLDSWLDWHPGGTKVIKHMVGRNAADEVNA